MNLCRFLVPGLGVLGMGPALLTAEPLELDAPIAAVELFPQGAVITRDVAMDAPTGAFTVEIADFPSDLDHGALQFAAVEGVPVRLLSLNFETADAPDPAEHPITAADWAEREALRAELRALNRQRTELQQAVSRASNLYTAVLQALRQEANEATAEAVALAQTLGPAIDAAQAELDAFDDETRGTLAGLNEQIAELDADIAIGTERANRRLGVLQLRLAAEATGAATVRLAYPVRRASWSAVYVLRARPEAGTVEIAMETLVRQNTGADWEDVVVRLSSSQLGRAGSPPPLGTVRLEPLNVEYGRGSLMRSREVWADAVSLPPPPESEVEMGLTGFAVQLAGRHAVETDAEPARLPVLAETAPAAFHSEVVPVVTTDAYLVGVLENPLDFPIIPGRADLFVDDRLVGRSRLAVALPGEELELGLGVNERLIVERQVVERTDAEAGLIDRVIKRVRKYETAVTSTMAVRHEVRIRDRFPVSGNSRITVRPLSPRDVEVDEGTGVFVWSTELAPAAAATLMTHSEVTFPVDWVVAEEF